MNVPVQHNPFSGDIVAKPSSVPALSAQAHTEQQRAVAEVQAAMMIARANPRDPISAVDRILNACTRPTLAEKALYSYSRGGTDITGPSIRLAEAVAQQWGNIQFGIRELDQRGDMSTVQAYAWDVETNTRREVVFQVPLIRHTKKGSYRLEDPRDIYEMVANQGARRVRACILGVIPGDVIEAAVSQCETTLNAKADTSPEAIQKMLAAFAEYGVTKEQIEARIQRRIEAIQPAQLVSLKKVYVSLRDGMSTAADWFEMPQNTATEAKPSASRTDSVKEKIKAAKQEAETATPVHDPQTGEIKQEVVESSPADAYELGKAGREAKRPRRVPPEIDNQGEAFSNAWLAGWDDQDGEMQKGKK